MTITLRHYEANSQLATHTQPQVQEPSAYWSLHFNLKKKISQLLWLCKLHATTLHRRLFVGSAHCTFLGLFAAFTLQSVRRLIVIKPTPNLDYKINLFDECWQTTMTTKIPKMPLVMFGQRVFSHINTIRYELTNTKFFQSCVKNLAIDAL